VHTKERWQLSSDAKTLIIKSEVDFPGFPRCAAYARLGEPDVALDWIEKAVRYGWRDAHWLASDPEFVPLHSQARFQTLQENLKLLPVLKFKTSAEP
jgi:hypothetical protein